MENILLAVMMVVLFAAGYFAVERFGKLMDEYYQWDQEPQVPCRKVFISKIPKNKRKTKYHIRSIQY